MCTQIYICLYTYIYIHHQEAPHSHHLPHILLLDHLRIRHQPHRLPCPPHRKLEVSGLKTLCAQSTWQSAAGCSKPRFLFSSDFYTCAYLNVKLFSKLLTALMGHC